MGARPANRQDRRKFGGALNGTAIARALSINGDCQNAGPSNPDRAKSGFFYAKQSAVLADGVAVGHSGDIVRDGSWQVGLGSHLELRW